jgi:23S rRNA (cytosine1962-C5)-methyltransferase
MSQVFLNRSSTHRILDGHPWVFGNEIERVDGAPQVGDTVEILHGKRRLGRGIYNAASQITVRRYTLDREELDENFLAKKLEAAVQYRERVTGLLPQGAERLFWSESDGLPGLIIDRYANVIVLQTLTAAMARREPMIVNWLTQRFPDHVILARNDVAVRKLEGLAMSREMLVGTYTAPTRIEVAGLKFDLDLWIGQKTGFYLDQVGNYAKAAMHAKGRRVLDVFCNQGAFALAALRAGAIEAIGIDQSDDALQKARAAATLNGLTVQWRYGNAFDLLRDYEQTRATFDYVILDPPSFTKAKAQVESAARGYHELHVRALKLLPPGGLLATFCCSHHVGEAEWRELLARAAVDSRCSLRLLDRFGQSLDHPVLTHVPETEYLRGFLVEKIS